MVRAYVEGCSGDWAYGTRGGTAVAAIVPMEECNALEAAVDELLARKALRTLAEEGDTPRATLVDVLADLFGTSAPEVT
ncbi:hypothetical protein [Streptomyces sp. MBT62]|uniref:hypothetical protein n=1 Tax=Streptomyces sp. MBT62 TaxID=2800410 RepID=UPI00190B8C65|nr:hypothetical protein [Streptomyces sp. MBT62]MBK3564894.1 hypothetical protein [Streptomyces sp. MBT62]